MDPQNIRPFDSFEQLYRILVLTGYYKHYKPKSNFLRICHQIYRPISFIIGIAYNLQHIIYVLQSNNVDDKRLEGLMIVIPQINLLTKLLTFNLQSSRVDRINELINDPIFAANGDKDKEIMVRNKYEMIRLTKIVNICITIAGICWPISHYIQRIRDETYTVPVYTLFKVNSWTTFTYTVLLQLLPMLWVGYGHLTLDCLVAAYYSQAQVQLKIIKYNLQHIFDTNLDMKSGTRFQYKDLIDRELRERFVYYTKRYEKVVWYRNEVNRLFNPSMSIQFFTSSATICMTIYRMSVTNVLSVKFVFLCTLIVILLIQVFVYCYFGNRLQYESRTVNTYMYMSDWTSLSPCFRRTILAAMLRWSKPLTTHVAGVIPVSLDTFISIVRSSYTLYTVLITKDGNRLK